MRRYVLRVYDNYNYKCEGYYKGSFTKNKEGFLIAIDNPEEAKQWKTYDGCCEAIAIISSKLFHSYLFEVVEIEVNA